MSPYGSDSCIHGLKSPGYDQHWVNYFSILHYFIHYNPSKPACCYRHSTAHAQPPRARRLGERDCGCAHAGDAAAAAAAAHARYAAARQLRLWLGAGRHARHRALRRPRQPRLLARPHRPLRQGMPSPFKTTVGSTHSNLLYLFYSPLLHILTHSLLFFQSRIVRDDLSDATRIHITGTPEVLDILDRAYWHWNVGSVCDIGPSVVPRLHQQVDSVSKLLRFHEQCCKRPFRWCLQS